MTKQKISKKILQDVIYAYITGEANPLHESMPKIELDCCVIHDNGLIEINQPDPILNAVISLAKSLKVCDGFALRLALYRLVECLVDQYYKEKEEKKDDQ
ncbi:hypothetical protein [Acidianus bottle-shaped virus 3 strain ABV3]|uniref:Uncharacterized protein n=1 Tax=Acidianus bottle-shaped virus 3 strain ABV3 TaxID=1732174 RepID=A0A0N9NXX1_9VIRU|nr:hypothetical protein AVU00_gp07 [Acidianus bottle-shaped virus 3 strain ABV3]ALG96809.1 hypothetical protein [Acidianus bottle-shaped virus 3 strain ABV3]